MNCSRAEKPEKMRYFFCIRCNKLKPRIGGVLIRSLRGTAPIKCNVCRKPMCEVIDGAASAATTTGQQAGGADATSDVRA